MQWSTQGGIKKAGSFFHLSHAQAYHHTTHSLTLLTHIRLKLHDRVKTADEFFLQNERINVFPPRIGFNACQMELLLLLPDENQGFFLNVFVQKQKKSCRNAHNLPFCITVMSCTTRVKLAYVHHDF